MLGFCILLFLSVWLIPLLTDLFRAVNEFNLSVHLIGNAGEMALLSSEEKELFDSAPVKADPDYPELFTHRFLVPESCSGIKTAEQLRALALKREDAAGIIRHFNILPTTHCNARCFYCFEKGMVPVSMTDESAEQTARFIISTHKAGKPVYISWFGGEPLLGKKHIDQICRRLYDAGIQYSSSMTTNGSLITSEIIEKMKSLWNLFHSMTSVDRKMLSSTVNIILSTKSQRKLLTKNIRDLWRKFKTTLILRQ